MEKHTCLADFSWENWRATRFNPQPVSLPEYVPALSEPQLNCLEHTIRIILDHRFALLCENTGTGKTFIAAAIAYQLMRCNKVAHVCIFAPAQLKTLWASVLNKFHVSYHFLSYQKISLGYPIKYRAATLFLLDEAHALKNPNTKRYQNLKDILKLNHTLFITATPVSTDFSNLAALLNIAGFPRKLNHNTLALRMFASAICSRFFAEPLTLSHLTIRINRRTLYYKAHPHIASVSDRILNTQWLVFNDNKTSASKLIPQILIHRLLSHPYACYQSLIRLKRYYSRCLTANRSFPLSRLDFCHIFGCEGLQLELPFLYDHEVLSDFSPAALDNLNNTLSDIVKDILMIIRSEDEKINAIKHYIHENHHQMIIFTQYTDTADYLADKLSSVTRVALITSQKSTLCKHSINREFLQSMFSPDFIPPLQWTNAKMPTPAVLIATDTLSTGHNLQKAQSLIHFDMPWNPATIHQREGRILRKNQSANQVNFITLDLIPPSQQLKTMINNNHRVLAQRKNILENWHAHIPQLQPDTPVLISTETNNPAVWAMFEHIWIPIHPKYVQMVHSQRTLPLSAAILSSEHPCKQQIINLYKALTQVKNYQSGEDIISVFDAFVFITAVFPALCPDLPSDSQSVLEQMKKINALVQLSPRSTAWMAYSS